MKIKWLSDAVEDLQSLRHYIAQDNPISAKRVVKKILHTTALLSEQPSLGRKGRVLNTRELIISGTPFIVPYRVNHGTVEILRVFHAAMQWPELEPA